MINKWTRLLAVVLLVCLLLTSCTSIGNGSVGQKSEAEYSQEVQNLEKALQSLGLATPSIPTQPSCLERRTGTKSC